MSLDACYSSSSESDNDSDDQQSCYNADQARAKRRALARLSFSVNKELSRAISKYSDDEDDDTLDVVPDRRGGGGGAGACGEENIDCKLLSSPRSSFCVNNAGSRDVVTSHNFHTHHHSNSLLPFSDDNSSASSTKKHIPQSDKSSRSRCFDYLVGAIDEAWARYCDAASYVEDENYGYNTPGSVGTDDEDECVGNTTDLTDYESDFEATPTTKPAMVKKFPMMAPSKKMGMMSSTTTTTSSDLGCSSTAKDPSSCQLQALKDRLIKAKYFLQDLVESDDYNDTIAFWKRWDMIKYATIELVEDDDDDEVIESTIDDLEDGRLFTS